MPPYKEIGLVLTYELSRFFHGLRAIFIPALYLLGMALFGTGFVGLYEKVTNDAMMKGLQAMALNAAAKSDTALGSTLKAFPVPIIFFFWISLIGIPLFAALTGFDLFSGDLRHRTLRFFSPRVRRGSLVVGRILSQTTVILSVILIADIGLCVYAADQLRDFKLVSGLAAMIRLRAYSIPCIIAYTALTALLSSRIRVPILSLMITLSLLFAMWIASIVCAAKPALTFLGYALPAKYDWGLLSVSWGSLLGSIGAYCGFSLLFVGLTVFSLNKRDL